MESLVNSLKMKTRIANAVVLFLNPHRPGLENQNSLGMVDSVVLQVCYYIPSQKYYTLGYSNAIGGDMYI